jgi:hypothetical protein
MSNVPTVRTPAKAQAVAVPNKAPPFMIKTRAERQESKFLKIMFYGDYGVGKTYLAATAAEVPSMGDVLLLSAESGELTIDTTDKHDFENIDSINVTSFRQVVNVYDFLKLHCQYRDENNLPELKKLQARLTGVDVEALADSDVKKYRTIIIDSLTEVEVYCMNQLLGIGDQTSLQDETQSAEWAEYKKQFHMIQRLIRAYRDLPIHVIMTCARQYSQDEQKRMIFGPNLTGKLSGAVQGFMDIVGYLTIGQADDTSKSIPRRMFIQPVGRYAAKNRFSSFKDTYFDNPTMKSILTQVGLLETNKPKT